MAKVFYIKGWTPFDLLSISKDEFYNVANEQYKKQFDKDINISYMELSFISKDKIKVKIIETKELQLYVLFFDFIVNLILNLKKDYYEQIKN